MKYIVAAKRKLLAWLQRNCDHRGHITADITMQQDAEKHQQQLEQQSAEALLKTGQEALKAEAQNGQQA